MGFIDNIDQSPKVTPTMGASLCPPIGSAAGQTSFFSSIWLPQMSSKCSCNQNNNFKQLISHSTHIPIVCQCFPQFSRFLFKFFIVYLCFMSSNSKLSGPTNFIHSQLLSIWSVNNTWLGSLGRLKIFAHHSCPLLTPWSREPCFIYLVSPGTVPGMQ